MTPPIKPSAAGGVPYPPPGSPPAAYLDTLQALSGEIETAMGAISRNSLAEIEESIGAQQVFCARLTSLAGRLRHDIEIQGTIGRTPAESSFDRRVSKAGETLRLLNQQYAALLRHSGRSIELFSSLCRSYTGQVVPGRSYVSQDHTGHDSTGRNTEVRIAGLKHQTWFCEM